MKKNFIQDLSYLNFTMIAIFTWWLIFGINISFEPYIWDDLSLFRNYTLKELINVWVGNWDPDGIMTKGYRPIKVLYFHLTYSIFGENIFLFRIFVLFEILFLIILTNQLFEKLNFSKNQIMIFTSLLVFSKIFATLVSWLFLSVLIFTYILALISIKFYFLSIEKKNNFYLIVSLLFAGFSILSREELYVLPAIIFLMYFYKFDINLKNILYCLKSTFLFFILVFVLMFLRKHFVPDALQIQLINYQIYFVNIPFVGDSIIRFGGYIQAVKSSFLPMGYLSSSYSDNIQKIFCIIWILLICFALILFLSVIKFNKKKLKKFLILFSLVIVSSLPHLSISRSFGIYLPSIFALMLISILIEKTFNSFNTSSNLLKFISKVLSVLIIFIGITGGVYRSNLHIESVNKFSNSIVQYDARMLYQLKDASIPEERFNYNKKHLENLNVYEYNWKKTYSGIVSPKIINNKYHPLRF